MSFISWLRSSQGFWEIVEYVGEIIVLIGVILEHRAESIGNKNAPKYANVIGVTGVEGKISITFFDDELKRKLAAKRATWVLIFGLVVALIGMVTTNRLSDEKIAALNNETARDKQSATEALERAGEANERAAKANKAAEDERAARLQLEAALSDRSLTPQQMDRLLASSKPFSGQKIDIFTFESSDGSLLAAEIYSPLLANKWDVREWLIPPNGYENIGIQIMYRDGCDKKTIDAATVICSILNEQPSLLLFPDSTPWQKFKNGPPTESGKLLNPKPSSNFAALWNDNNEADIRVLVGPKHDAIGMDSERMRQVLIKLMDDEHIDLQNIIADLKQQTKPPQPPPATKKPPAGKIKP